MAFAEREAALLLWRCLPSWGWRSVRRSLRIHRWWFGEHVVDPARGDHLRRIDVLRLRECGGFDGERAAVDAHHRLRRGVEVRSVYTGQPPASRSSTSSSRVTERGGADLAMKGAKFFMNEIPRRSVTTRRARSTAIWRRVAVEGWPVQGSSVVCMVSGAFPVWFGVVEGSGGDSGGDAAVDEQDGAGDVVVPEGPSSAWRPIGVQNSSNRCPCPAIDPADM
jgi:hypothetical protein